ncbi:MAG: TIGR02281 family clan AA aspartic protease [Sphingomicrobium sp.]
MARAYLLIIIVGVMIGAMLPSRLSDRPARTTAVDSSRETRIVRRVDRDRADASLAASVVSGQGSTLQRAPDGHFYADAQVNGITVHFLVDTGASGVALSAADARRVGLPFFPTEFTAVGRGASGEVRGKLVTLDRVSLGGKSVDNVGGAILEGSEMSLLGQSFLSRMGTIEMTPDRMVIR